MGKTNKANRTKGNMRPSSSGHSAELLGPSSGFVGFAALGGKEGSFVPVTGDAADTSVDSDFRMVMRKMLKRDAITRLKAVQEFGDYCVEKEKDVVKNVLPFWPRLFNRLVLDLDRRVREATHVSNGKLLSKVGRDVAPHLRNIMAVWLLGQCDLHAPASSMARETFAQTFPQEAKRGEAVLFCRSEVIAHFKDNLFEQTAKSMSEPNPTSPEDMESKYHLVIGATLQALKLFLQLTKATNDNNVEQDMQAIVKDGKFWKYAKSKEPQIRAAWFSLVSCLCQNCQNVFDGTEKKLATTVFGQLSESDPVVAPSVWESALSIVINREDCWQVVNISSVALPQLWLLLKGGGKGNASALFPCLLPLISRLPKETAHSEAFLKQFFSCLGQSLMLDSVKLSTSECDAILSAFFECLQFMCCTRLSDKEGEQMLREIVTNEIIPLLSASLQTEEGGHLAVSRLYPLLSSLVRRAEQKKMASVVEGFWQHALPVACNAFEGCREKTVAFLGYFFHSMVQQTAEGRKEKKVVRFKDEEKEEESMEGAQPTGKPSNPSDSPNTGSASIGEELSNQSSMLDDGSASLPHIATFCARLCQEIGAKGCPLALLRLLEEILTSANSKALVTELANNLSKEGRCESDSVSSFLVDVVLKWLSKVREDEKCIDVLLNIVLLSCSFLTAEEASAVLDGCCKVRVLTVEHVLRRGLELCRGASFFRGWLEKSRCSSQVVQSLRALVEGKMFFSEVVRPSDMEVCRRTLKLCLLDEDTDLLIDDSSFGDVLTLLHDLSVQLVEAKRSESETNTQLALSFICSIAGAATENYKRCWKFDATEKLVHLIFNTCLKEVYLFEHTDDEVLKALLCLLNSSLDSYCRGKKEVTTESSLIVRIAKDLNSKLHSLQTEREALRAKMLSVFLLACVYDSLGKKDTPTAMFVCSKLTEMILPSEETWKTLMEGLALNVVPSFLAKKFFCPVPVEDRFFYPEENVLGMSLASQAVSDVLYALALKFVGDDVVLHVRHIIWCVAFCTDTRKRLETSELSTWKRLKTSCLNLLSVMKKEEIEALKQDLFDHSLKDTSWAICLETLGELLPCCDLKSLAEEQFQHSSDLDMVEGIQKHMTRQVLIPYLPLEKKKMYFEELLIELKDSVQNMKDLKDTNFCGKIGEVCCYLNEQRLEVTQEMKQDIGVIFRSMAPFLKQCDEEDDLSMMLNFQLEDIFCAFSSPTKRFIDPEVWEFFTERLDTLQDRSCRLQLSAPRSLLLLHRALKLYFSMSSFTESDVTEDNLLAWRPEPLSEKTDRRIIQLYLFVAMHEVVKFEPGCFEVTLSLLKDCVGRVPMEVVLGSLFFSRDGEVAFRRTVDLLSSPVRQLQIASHYVIVKVMSQLPNLLQNELPQADEDSDDDEKKEYEKIPEKLWPLTLGLRSLGDIVESMLMDIKIGDACAVIPNTDSYRISMAYLLGWTSLLEFMSASPSQVRHGYATDLCERGLLPSLFSNVFRMLPENPVLLLRKRGTDAPRKEDLKRLFLSFKLYPGSPCSEEVETVACFVFAKALNKVPASIRSWWNNLDRKSSDIVNNFTSKYISAHLCAAEIQAVQEHERQFENLTVQARPSCREVVATYVVDECPVELCVSLPPNHPLGPLTAEKRGKGGQAVGEAEWRSWLMQLTTLLTHQNGSIQEGLAVWKRNLDKKFEGVEECTICYMILHSSTLKLPRLSCHVCRKKFHSACLYKWFRTSNNSTCPLCRNEFTM